MNGIFIIAHTPLASAFLECVRHVFPDSDTGVAAFDVQPQTSPEETLAQAGLLLEQLGLPQALVLTDVFGATPCNVAQKLVNGTDTKLVTGMNLPMLLRAMCYRHEPLDMLVARALAGASQGVMQVAVTAPQNQVQRNHDQEPHDHQQ